MAVSLYDAVVGTYTQILPAVGGVLEKGRSHLEAEGGDLGEIVETRLHPDMLPLSFQVQSVMQHSLGALQAVEAGAFSPPTTPDTDYAGLQALITEAIDGLNGYDRETVNAMAGRDVTFRAGENEIPFVAEDFLLTFSLPNFYFHATTVYDILRMKGVPIGKRDFMGRMRIKR